MAKKKVKDSCHLSGMHAMLYVFLIIFGGVLLKTFFVNKLGYSWDMYNIFYYGFWFLVTLVMLLYYEFR